MNIDDRLRAASKALQESSVAQVDAASRLREIVGSADQVVAHGRVAVLPDPPQEPERHAAPPLPPPAAQLRRKPPRLAVAVSLMLVLALGVLLGSGARHWQDAATTTPTTTPPVSTVFVTQPNIQPPTLCLRAVEQADKVIALQEGEIRDDRLEAALESFNTARQQCQRSAPP